MGGLRLEGKSVLLTGATGGIGEAIARALHARDASVVLSGRRAEVLERLRDELGSRAEVEQADLTEHGDVNRLAERVASVDVLVYNAALPASGRLDEFTPEQLDRALDVNLRAALQLGRAAAIAMVERGSGHMVFISSLSGKVATPGSALYSATKFGVRGMAAGLREDMAPHGIGVTTVFPGFIRDAGMFHEAGVELPRGVGTRSPDEVAAAVVRGIERGKDEVDVAPLAMRVGTVLSSVAPVTLAKIQRRLPSSKLSAEIAEGQAHKR
jgi:short-subunit dehydrogenase